jgi:RNA polymerase sigma-70 factor (ECF subfamily)
MATTAEVLFHEYRDVLFRYLSRAVGGTDAAHDLTQDVFVRVTRSTVPSATTSEVRAWLFRIARNLAIDHLRRRARTAEDLRTVVEPRQSAPQDLEVALNEALARLDQLDRDVFLMHEVAGLRYVEIAEACDLTLGAVRSRIHRARLQLRSQLSHSITAGRAAIAREASAPEKASEKL